MFREPAVSIPTNFLTNTFLFNSLFMFEERTNVIIIGSPSGTAITTTATLNVNAYKRCDEKSLNSSIFSKLKLFETTTALNI